MSLVGTGLAVGGKLAGAGLIVYAAMRFALGLLEWIGRRWDAHVARMVEREALSDKSIADRMRNLEKNETALYRQVEQLTRAVQLLADRVRRENPADPALVEVAQILASSFGPPSSDVPQDMTDTLGEMK